MNNNDATNLLSLPQRLYLPRVEAALLLPFSLYSCMNLSQDVYFQESEDQRKLFLIIFFWNSQQRIFF